MKHECPYCGADLRFQLIKSTPVPGERKFLPNRAYSSCRKCDGVLVVNPHPFEGKQSYVMGVFILPIMFHQEISNSTLRLSLLFISIVGLFWSCIYFKTPRHWPRYRQANDEDLIKLGLVVKPKSLVD